MSGIWSELGIEPTLDARDIKRAYAQRLKATRPEDDPQGFQRLRSAYEAALSRCQSAKQSRPAAEPAGVVTQIDLVSPPAPATLREPPPLDPVHGDATARPESQEPPRSPYARTNESEQQAEGQPDQETIASVPPEPPAKREPLQLEQLLHKGDAHPAPSEPYREPPYKRANELVRSLFVTIDKEGGAAAAELLAKLAQVELIDLELRELFESKLLRKLSSSAERPLHVLALASQLFHWEDNRHPLRDKFRDIFVAGVEAQKAFAARGMLEQLADGLDKTSPNGRNLQRAARMLLEQKPKWHDKLWSQIPGVLDGVEELLRKLHSAYGATYRLTLSSETLAYWERLVRYHPRWKVVHYAALYLVTILAFTIAGANDLLPVNTQHGESAGVFIAVASAKAALVLLLIGRYLAVQYGEWRTAQTERARQWYAKAKTNGTLRRIAWGFTVVSVIGLFAARDYWQLAGGLAAYAMGYFWVRNYTRFLLLLVVATIPAALLMKMVDKIPGHDIPYAGIHIVALLALHGLLQAVQSRWMARKVWQPLSVLINNRHARIGAGITAAAIAVALGFFDETGQAYGATLAYVLLGFWINDRLRLFASIAYGLFSCVMAAVIIPQLHTYNPPFFTVHLLITVVSYLIFLSYAALCVKQNWQVRTQAFFVALAGITFAGGIMAN